MPTKRRYTFEQSMLILRYAMFPIACWSLPAGTGASDVRLRSIAWWFGIIHLTVNTTAWFWNIYLNLDNFDIAIKSVTELCTMITAILKMYVCRIEASRLQDLLAEMDLFLKNATAEEWELMMRYYDRYFTSHSIIFIISVFTPLCFILEPALHPDQPFPGTVAYPFSVEPFWIWATLYLSQVLLAVQVGSMLLVDFMYAILLWFTSARFELLAIEFSNVTNEDEFRRCIKKHQELIQYFLKLRITVRKMAVIVFSTVMFAVTTAGFTLVRNPPLFDLAKYIFFEFLGGMQFLVITWPSDHLLDMGERVRRSVYNCAWVGQSPSMLKDLIIVLQRSNSPLIIGVDGVFSDLSLEFFGSSVAASFSYIATLRAVAGD